MKFFDEKHKKFYEDKMLQLKNDRINIDQYISSLIYILGLSEETREHFKEIIDLNKREINIDSIQEAWQTNTTRKLTRMAFSLFNGCSYDSEGDIDKEQVSTFYNVSELFDCWYAPYFWEGIKIRFPEYTNTRK